MTTLIRAGSRHISDAGIGSGASSAKAGSVIEFDALKHIADVWYQHGDSEIQLGPELMAIEIDSRLQAGKTIVRRLRHVPAHVVEGPNGRVRIEASTQELFYRATLHPSGTAEYRLARAKAAKQKRPPKPFAPTVVDPPPLVAQPERVRAFSQGGVPLAAISPPTPAVRGREAVIAWLAKAEVILEPVNGYLLAKVRGGIPSVPAREVLSAYARLLPSWVAGKDMPCDVCGAPAVVPALLDAVLCADHAAD